MTDASSHRRWLSLGLSFGLLILVILVTALIINGLHAFKPEAKKRPPKPESVLKVHAVIAQIEDYQVEIHSRGLVKAQTQSTLAAEVSGTVVAVSEQLRKGGRFTQGDWLMTIDPRDYEVAVKLAKANLTQARLALDEERARSMQALRDWERLATRLKPQKAQQPPDLVLRKPQLAAAEAELASASAQLEQAKLDLARTQIVAPFDGLVLNQFVDIGQYLNVGNELAELSGQKLEIELPVSANWRPYLNGADPSQNATSNTLEAQVILTVGEAANMVGAEGDQNSPRRWLARIVRDSGQISSQSRQITLIANVMENEDSGQFSWQLLPGDYASARIKGRVLHNVVVVPRSALVDGQYVWLVKEQRLQKTSVDVLWLSDQHLVVASHTDSVQGLRSGDQVVTSTLSFALSGTKVEVIEQSPHVIEQPPHAIEQAAP